MQTKRRFKSCVEPPSRSALLAGLAARKIQARRGVREDFMLAHVVLALFLPFVLQQGNVYDQARTQFHDAVSTGAADGLPVLVGKLDAIAKAFPSSPFAPYIHETIHAVALLHPGTVPDQGARLQALKASASANPALAQVLQRLEIFRAYSQAAAQGKADGAAASLLDPAIAGSFLGMQAQADAALRSGAYARAEALARQVIEIDPYSPLLANAHMVLGLSASYRGETQAGLRHFRNALAASPLPTLYGDTRQLLFTAYRFARPAPAPVGDVFDDVSIVRLAAASGLKDPQGLIPAGPGFLLADKEQMVMVTVEGKILETKPARRIEDVAVGAGKTCLLTEDGIDLGGGSFVPLSLNVGGKPKAVKKLRSLAPDPRGDIYLLDQDQGLLRATPGGAGSPALTLIAPMKGRLLRIDSRANLYILASDGKSILVLTRQGKQIASIVPDPTGGKESNIEYFALDALNHLYVLDQNSIQIFTMIDRSAGLDKVRISTIPMDPRPQFKDLKVLAVSPTGEIVTTGKNDDNWVCYR
jgi:tetratricopeptide (TPR) repeat protein